MSENVELLLRRNEREKKKVSAEPTPKRRKKLESKRFVFTMKGKKKKGNKHAY